MVAESNLRKTLRYIIYNGVASSSMTTMTGSPIIITYAMLLGASPVNIGLIGNIEYIGLFSYFIASFLINKGCSVKNMSVNFSFFARFFYLVIALLAFFAGNTWVVGCLLLSLFMSNFIGSISGGFFHPWMKSLLPTNILAPFFAERFRWMTATSLIFYLFTAGFFYIFDNNFPEYKIYAYSIIFFFAFVSGLCCVYTFTRIQNITLPCNEGRPFLHKVWKVAKDKSVIMMSGFLGIINFSICFITPFITVYILSVLKFSVSTLIILMVVSNISYITLTKKIGYKVKKFGCYYAIITGMIGYILSLICLIGCLYFENWFVISLLILGHIFLGISRFIVDLGSNNILLLFVPERDSSIYISIINFIRAAFATASGIISGYLLTYLNNLYDNTDIIWLLFLSTGIACFLGVLASALSIRRLIKC